MEIKTYELDSGKVCVSIYTRDDLKLKKFIRWVVDDIYKHLPEFNDPIYFIDETKPAEGKEVCDVLNEYTEKYGKDKIILTRGCILTRDPNNVDMLMFIFKMISMAEKAGFCRILFNRCLGNSYNLMDVCIFMNDKAKEWIKNNTGEDKIIKHVLSSHRDNEVKNV